MILTVDLDPNLFESAMALATPDTKPCDLLNTSLQAFIRSETTRQLTALGGQAPEIQLVLRRAESDT